MYINPVVSGKRTLGSISCNPTTFRSLQPIPLNWVPWELLQDSDSSYSTIAPHWSSTYPEYLSLDLTKEEQRRIVWSRLYSHRYNLAERLKTTKERYLQARRELNPRSTQVESSHDPLYRDTQVALWPLHDLAIHLIWLKSCLSSKYHHSSPCHHFPLPIEAF